MDSNIVHNINYRELAQEVSAQKEISPKLSHKEIISNVLEQKGMPPMSSRPVVSAPSVQPINKNDDSVLPAYAKKSDPSIRNKIQHLISLTLEKGLKDGIDFAKKEDPFVIDAYHDSLSDVLIEEIKKRKLI